MAPKIRTRASAKAAIVGARASGCACASVRSARAKGSAKGLADARGFVSEPTMEVRTGGYVSGAPTRVMKCSRRGGAGLEGSPRVWPILRWSRRSGLDFVSGFVVYVGRRVV